MEKLDSIDFGKNTSMVSGISEENIGLVKP
jgi:hypothetical protein